MTEPALFMTLLRWGLDAVLIVAMFYVALFPSFLWVFPAGGIQWLADLPLRWLHVPNIWRLVCGYIVTTATTVGFVAGVWIATGWTCALLGLTHYIAVQIGTTLGCACSGYAIWCLLEMTLRNEIIGTPEYRK